MPEMSPIAWLVVLGVGFAYWLAPLVWHGLQHVWHVIGKIF